MPSALRHKAKRHAQRNGLQRLRSHIQEWLMELQIRCGLGLLSNRVQEQAVALTDTRLRSRTSQLHLHV